MPAPRIPSSTATLSATSTGKDLVPHLPPNDSDAFQHFGREYRYDRAWKETSNKPIEQMGDLVGLIEAPLGFVASKFRLLRGIPFRFSLNESRPAALYLRHHPGQGAQRVRRRYLIPGEVTSHPLADSVAATMLSASEAKAHGLR